MNLGVQYYRAPFPEQHHWQDDLRKMRRSGFNTVQLWISWGWVEATPGQFIYDDYDRLIELAAREKLQVVLSTIAEIQPNWIPRVIPDGAMIDSFGRTVISSGRDEHHFGITPGGCFDHPEVWARMAEFLERTGKRYAGLEHLHGWDIWNELRWNVNADGLVCYCPHTLAAFRRHLEARFGSLEGLNDAWKRRYCSWEDVLPGKVHGRLYTEMMAFQYFLTCRANEHAARRYEVMRRADPVHTITAHGAQPSALYAGNEIYFAIDRGNDWDLADRLDGIGCSSFPQWSGIDAADFGQRIDMVKSAARGKKVWLSELQGGRSAVGFDIFGVVRAEEQQRWIWNGLACGADTILFWCWRDEVFGRESCGFGIDGNDGFAEERLAASTVSGELLARHADIFDRYVPDTSSVGIFFSPQSYYLDWAQEGNARRVRDSLTGYGRALTKCSIPFVSVEECHLEALEQLQVLFMPQVLVTSPAVEQALMAFVERGGTLVIESECGAFAPNGVYRYPEERFYAAVPLVEAGRRNLESSQGSFFFNGYEYQLNLAQWTTPTVDARSLCTVAGYGKGRIIHLGSYPGLGYRTTYCSDFELLLRAIVASADAGRMAVRIRHPEVGEKEFLYVKSGKSGERTVLFVFFPEELEDAELELAPELFPHGFAMELFSGQRVPVGESGNPGRMKVRPGRFRMAIYCGE